MEYAFEVDMYLEDIFGFGMEVRCICLFYQNVDVVLCRHG